MGEQKIKSEKQYRKYIEEHTVRVAKVFRVLSVKYKFALPDSLLRNLEKTIVYHDRSKYGVHEFEEYRKKFFTSNNELSNNEEFHRAWVHHVANNPHHWEHWVTFKEGKPNPCEMPSVYVFEMLCDWTAMSLYHRNHPMEWWKDNKSNIIVHEKTLVLIDEWIYFFNEIYETLLPLEVKRG